MAGGLRQGDGRSRNCVGYADGVVRVEVEDGAWLRQLMSMRGQLARRDGSDRRSDGERDTL